METSEHEGRHYLEEWGPPFKPMSLSGKISPEMHGSWITNALASRESRLPRFSGSIVMGSRGGRITLPLGCGGDMIPDYVFTVWQCAWSGPREGLTTVNFSSSSR